MKEAPVSNVEKDFIINCIKKNMRLDGRKLNEFRPLKINFGNEYGTVHVTLGDTRVLAQISCEIGEPKFVRPNEGLLYVNIDLNQMAAVNFESGRNVELTNQLNRLLERTFKDSRCVDLESLCISSDERVWILRVNLIVLNHEGNVLDCASIATLCALAHFRRPSVSIDNNEIKIYAPNEREPIPNIIHHYPVCISFASFENGNKVLVDPTILEEQVSDVNLVYGFNSYQEVCCINLGGTTLTSIKLFLNCAREASKRAQSVVNIIKAALKSDEEERLKGKVVGFAECLRAGNIISLPENRLTLKLPNFTLNPIKIEQEQMDTDENSVETIDKITILNSEQSNIRWVPDRDSSDETNDSETENENEELDLVKKLNQEPNIAPKIKSESNKRTINESSSDSEEDTIMLENILNK